jgi:zinc/manganese transport system substrate-binding protein
MPTRLSRRCHDHRRNPAVLVTAAILFFGLVWAGEARAARPLRVVASVPDLAALAKELGAGRVEVSSLTLPTQDPHYADARPSLALRLNRADLLVWNGLDLEAGWLPGLVTSARNPRIQRGTPGSFDASSVVKPLEIPRGPVDRSQGDIHPGGNPHYGYDPRAMLEVARALAARMSALDGPGAPQYAAAFAAFERSLREARRRWEEKMARFRGAAVVSHHRSFSYLLDWLGLVNVGYVEPKPGVPPSPAHVAALLDEARRRQVRLVLREPYQPDRITRLLADQLPAAHVVLPAATDFERGERYLAHVDRIVELLHAALAAGGGRT